VRLLVRKEAVPKSFGTAFSIFLILQFIVLGYIRFYGDSKSVEHLSFSKYYKGELF